MTDRERTIIEALKALESALQKLPEGIDIARGELTLLHQPAQCRDTLQHVSGALTIVQRDLAKIINALTD